MLASTAEAKPAVTFEYFSEKALDTQGVINWLNTAPPEKLAELYEFECKKLDKITAESFYAYWGAYKGNLSLNKADAQWLDAVNNFFYENTDDKYFPFSHAKILLRGYQIRNEIFKRDFNGDNYADKIDNFRKVSLEYCVNEAMPSHYKKIMLDPNNRKIDYSQP
jgi:hypothetical protein